MHWSLVCLMVLGTWIALDVVLVAIWVFLISRRDARLLREGRMVETSYYPSAGEEAAVKRARELLA